MTKFELIKGVTSNVAGFGVGMIVGNFTELIMPPKYRKLMKAATAIGSIALTGVLGNAAQHYVEQQFDDLKEKFDESKVMD